MGLDPRGQSITRTSACFVAFGCIWKGLHSKRHPYNRSARDTSRGLRPADNTRVGKLGALSGWDQLRARITGKDGTPMLYVFDTCRDFIRTVPCLQHDRDRPEDLDTDTEDHIADETRYACLARPWFAPARKDPEREREEAWRRTWRGAGGSGVVSWKVM